MNENLDLTKILKDCPKGTKLYSTIYGDVCFKGVDLRCEYPISFTHSTNCSGNVTSKGLHYIESNGECTLFPSKDQRDWSKWHIPFKDGDVVYANVDDISYILIYHKQEDNTIYRHVCFCLETNTLSYDERIFTEDPVRELRYVSEEEKQLFFDAIREKGYRWNAERKTLEKLIIPKFKVGDRIRHKTTNKDDVYEISKVYDNSYGLIDFTWMIYMKHQDQYELVPNKFDHKILKPFDRVLARYTKSDTWKALYFSHLSGNNSYPYFCGSGLFKYCIPYNEETKHLIGTDKEAPEYYRYWED